MSNDLTPIHLYVLLHLKRAKVDYAKMMAKLSHIKVEAINSCIEDLVKAGLVERDSGSAIKRSKAKFKKAFEVRKHHTYYKLTREGERFVRRIDERWLRDYFDSLMGDGTFEDLMELRNGKRCKRLEKFIQNGLATPSGRLSRLLELIFDFAEV